MVPLPSVVLVPRAVVPCQYQVISVGGDCRVSVAVPQLRFEITGADGSAGVGFTVTATTAAVALQHPEEGLLALR